MLNAIISVTGKPSMMDKHPDTFKQSVAMRNVELSVDRCLDDNMESVLKLTFTSFHNTITCIFKVEDLQVRGEEGSDMHEGSYSYKDINKLDKEIGYIQDMIMAKELYKAHIWINEDFLNEFTETEDPIEVDTSLLDSKPGTYSGPLTGPTDSSDMGYRGGCEYIYDVLHGNK